ncbi:hypothetical protein AG1IA_07263 [Rhizoctonia solani AG-1 IA]|uniref:Uncharacterized protein n=1 Tax=Thanatephorus cucumeris (strain AG1-IA) TaxID=983506 RepID=L8WPM3_THACA|nr:hypothetical protein AG1IA_07263 [Rhizoctonia solani AG-1 IA]
MFLVQCLGSEVLRVQHLTTYCDFKLRDAHEVQHSDPKDTEKQHSHKINISFPSLHIGPLFYNTLMIESDGMHMSIHHFLANNFSQKVLEPFCPGGFGGMGVFMWLSANLFIMLNAHNLALWKAVLVCFSSEGLVLPHGPTLNNGGACSNCSSKCRIYNLGGWMHCGFCLPNLSKACSKSSQSDDLILHAEFLNQIDSIKARNSSSSQLTERRLVLGAWPIFN